MKKIMIASLIILIVFVSGCVEDIDTSNQNKLNKFSSYEELEDFVKTNSGNYYSYGMMGRTMTEELATTTGGTTAQKSVSESVSSDDYSKTNIQVEGVDEADIVKTDGKYVYVVSGNKVVILDAYPAENAKILSDINFETNPHEIFVNDDKLVVFGQKSYSYPSAKSGTSKMGVSEEIMISPRYYYSGTFINIYDVSNREEPKLIRNISLDGNYFDSRMIEDHVYVVANRGINYGGTEPIPLPVINSDGEIRTTKASEIYYFDIPDRSYLFTNIISINIHDDNEELKTETFLMGYSRNMYVSLNNIYIVYSKQVPESLFYDKIIDEVIIPSVPSSIRDKISEIQDTDFLDESEKMEEIGEVFAEYLESLGPEEGAKVMKNLEEKIQKIQEEIAKETEKTVIHKISITNGNIEYEENGEVPGQTLNQFSMDEYEGNFRIATTTGNWRAESMNHVYVLDKDLNIVGKVEDLAKGERIYSVRFMGDKGYMVTFKQVDPLFVIDLKDPENPKVLGYLKIPGVSDYLHPYDENHVIGVGRDATEEGRIQGMKLSLFDVTNFENPKEMSKYIIGERGTDSDVLRDHKAFLFSKPKNLLVIPVRVSEDGKWNSWQGAYVFNLDLDNGFVLKGKVTHRDNITDDEERYRIDYNAQIKRSLYIDNILYTVSNKIIKMSDLDNLDEINKVELS